MHNICISNSPCQRTCLSVPPAIALRHCCLSLVLPPWRSLYLRQTEVLPSHCTSTCYVSAEPISLILCASSALLVCLSIRLCFNNIQRPPIFLPDPPCPPPPLPLSIIHSPAQSPPVSAVESRSPFSRSRTRKRRTRGKRTPKRSRRPRRRKPRGRERRELLPPRTPPRAPCRGQRYPTRQAPRTFYFTEMTSGRARTSKVEKGERRSLWGPMYFRFRTYID